LTNSVDGYRFPTYIENNLRSKQQKYEVRSVRIFFHSRKTAKKHAKNGCFWQFFKISPKKVHNSAFD
jgi:hypothetical protein